ncbi:hypothetical protein [Chamaesiphon sp. VAR_48_metabat_403]|uniref:hypothetical protein n=1 Tax=Chamaesiphon sp. VAR_48_metabat_403 TaxID=2964700 RepID=UPI00286E2F26|nr:hypothetical protein [Chamaesiphon sp. VAR_48_metabat_403]
MQKLLLLSGIALLSLTSISLNSKPAIAGCGWGDITCNPTKWTCPPGGCVEEEGATLGVQPTTDTDIAQQLHSKIIGGYGGPLYVGVAKDILKKGTVQDLRNFLIDRPEALASIQRVHNQVIGGSGGPLYIDAAKSILRRPHTSLNDVRKFLIDYKAKN